MPKWKRKYRTTVLTTTPATIISSSRLGRKTITIRNTDTVNFISLVDTRDVSVGYRIPAAVSRVETEKDGDNVEGAYLAVADTANVVVEVVETGD
jgi:hypothetical protein